MALHKLILLISLFAVVFATDLCSNSDEKTVQDLENIQKYVLDTPVELENEKELPAVVPGELSPLVPCEIMRKKRKAINTFDNHVFRSRFFSRRDEDVVRNKCPIGYHRIAFRCIKRD